MYFGHAVVAGVLIMWLLIVGGLANRPRDLPLTVTGAGRQESSTRVHRATRDLLPIETTSGHAATRAKFQVGFESAIVPT
jgi:hypothetical protein